MTLLRILAAAALLAVFPGCSRRVIVLENEAVKVTVDLGGGSIAEFRFRDGGLNPLTGLARADAGRSVYGFGHFLCLDRWGPGTGKMPFHGEASHVMWKVVQAPQDRNGNIEAIMEATLPLANLTVRRTLQIDGSNAVLDVREEVTNHNSEARPYNMVQHATLGRPFLDVTTLVDCDGKGGLDQDNPAAAAKGPAFTWPMAKKPNGEVVDVRRLEWDAKPSGTTFHIESDLGWITAATPAKGLLIGYIWRSRDFPWVSHWRKASMQPDERGLEFGTAGRHAPMETLVAQGTLWNHPLFETLEAGATATRHYQAFLLRVPVDFRGIGEVSVKQNQIVLREAGASKPREWIVPTTGLPPL